MPALYIISSLLTSSSIVEKRRFLKSFVNEIIVVDGTIRINYTLLMLQEISDEEKLLVLPFILISWLISLICGGSHRHSSRWPIGLDRNLTPGGEVTPCKTARIYHARNSNSTGRSNSGGEIFALYYWFELHLFSWLQYQCSLSCKYF